MASQNVVEITDANFDEVVLKSAEPVLVDFSAEWCGPCRAMAPLIDKLADEYSGRAKVGKVDIDASRDVAIKYSIEQIPTLLVFRGGVPARRFVGLGAGGLAAKERELKQALDAA